MNNRFKVAFLAAMSVAGLCTEAMAQRRWLTDESPNWNLPRCYSYEAYMLFPCGDQIMYLRARVPVTTRFCCSPLTINAGAELSGEGQVGYSACGFSGSFKVSAKTTASVSMTFSQAQHCGRVQVFIEQGYTVKKVLKTLQTCWPDGTSEFFTETRTVEDMIIGDLTIVPYFYTADPNPCPGCGSNGRPVNPSTPADTGWDPSLPHGFPILQPSGRPQPEAVPWDIDTMGPPPSSMAIASDGGKMQTTIDMSDWGKRRGIDSVYSLTLYECFEVHRALTESYSEPYGCGPMTRARVVVVGDAEFVGPIMHLCDGLRRYAEGMVNSPSYGDFDQNGVRDLQDLEILYNHIAAIETPQESRPYDIDGDGKVDDADAAKWLDLVFGQ